MGAAQPDPAAAKDAEITRLRKRLRACQKTLRAARTELATRPASPAAEPLSDAQVRHLHAQFTPSAPGTSCATCGRAHRGPCETCGGIHAHACPRVKSVEYEVHGDTVMIRKVAYWRHWDTTGVMFASELPPLPEEES